MGVDGNSAPVDGHMDDRSPGSTRIRMPRSVVRRVGLTTWLGTAGAVLVTLGSFGVGDPPRADTTLARLSLSWVTYGHGKSVSAVAFWVGVAMIVAVWVRLGRGVLESRALDRGALGHDDPVRPRPSVAQLRWTAAMWTAPLLFSAPVYSRDVYAYLAQASLLTRGANPYVDGPASAPGPLVDSMAQVWATTTAPYGPFFMSLAHGVTRITGEHPTSGVLLMRLVMLPGWALVIWAAPVLARQIGRDPRTALWLTAINPMLLIHLVAGPHVEMLMAGLLVAGVVVVLARRHVAGLTILAVATSVKVTAGVAIPFVVWIWLAHIRRERPVRPRDVAAVLGAVIGVSVLVFGAFTLALGRGFGWLNGLGYADQIVNWLTVPTAVAHLITLVMAPFVATPLGPVLSVSRTVGAALLAVLLATIWWRARRDATSAVVGIALAMAAVLALEPSTLPWYYSWALVFAVALAPGRRAFAVIAAACVYLLLVFQPDDSILLYEPIDGLLALAPALLVAAVLWRRDDRGSATPAPATTSAATSGVRRTSGMRNGALER